MESVGKGHGLEDSHGGGRGSPLFPKKDNKRVIDRGCSTLPIFDFDDALGLNSRRLKTFVSSRLPLF